MNAASQQKQEMLQLQDFYLDKELQWGASQVYGVLEGVIWSACLFLLIYWPLQYKACRKDQSSVYSCRRLGCGFWETSQHGTVTLVILNGLPGAVTGQCEPKPVCRLSPPRRLQWLKMAGQLNLQPQALFRVSCQVPFSADSWCFI